KTERPGRCDLAAERTIFENEVKFLAVDERMRKIDHAFDLVCVRRFDGHFAVAVGEFDLFQNAKIAPFGGLLGFAGGAKEFDPIFARTMQDRDLDIIEFDKTVVDAGSAKRGQKMLARR